MTEGFDALKGRLDEIVEEVGREDISLDEALRLYEEAVNIGIAACDASELDVPADGAEAEADGGESEADDAEAEIATETISDVESN